MRKVRPQSLIDALEARKRTDFEGRTWRSVSKGRDPLAGYASGGRWDDGTFDALYTSLDRDGAIAEAVYHQRRGQPIIPSKPPKLVYSIDVSLTGVLDLGTMDDLTSLGINAERFGRLSYVQRVEEYPSLQEVAEVAHFLAFEGLVVPSARWDCRNLVIFTERCKPENVSISSDGELLDLEAWYRAHGETLSWR